MNKELQDKVWACLPKEVRKEIKRKYKIAENDIGLFVQTFILEGIFGYPNLTSDTEPVEMLMVEREKVQKAYNAVNSDMRRSVLEDLFGDKCFPDTEPKTPKLL